MKARLRPLLLSLTAAALVGGGGVALGAGSATPGAGVPAYDHIFTVVFENHARSAIIGSSSAPYLNSLASANAQSSQYFAVSHPSLPNYLALAGGSTFGVSNDCSPASCPQNQPNLADRVEASGRTWKAYQESMPAACGLSTSGSYAPKHNPFVYFNDIRQSPRCAADDVPYTALAGDLSSAASTPNYVEITPNLCNDMHDCSVATGDSWAKSHLAAIFGSPAWTSQRSLMLITWDEDDGGHGNNVAFIAMASDGSVKTHYTSTVHATHYSYLRTLEAAWGLPPLTSNDTAASPMGDLFVAGTPTPTPTLTASPTPSPSSSTTPSPSASPSSSPSPSGTPGGSLDLAASADAYVYISTPDTNHASANPLLFSAGSYRAYLKFPALPAGSSVLSVSLILNSTVSPSSGGIQVRSEPASWTESGLTWNHQPAWSSTVLATSAIPQLGQISIALPVAAVTPGQETDLGLSFSVSGWIQRDASREDGSAPPLLRVVLG